jgi:hypothetical protein
MANVDVNLGRGRAMSSDHPSMTRKKEKKNKLVRQVVYIFSWICFTMCNILLEKYSVDHVVRKSSNCLVRMNFIPNVKSPCTQESWDLINIA